VALAEAKVTLEVLAMAHEDDTPAGFLSRWSRRKADAREGRVLQEPALPLATVSQPQNLRTDLSTHAPEREQAPQADPQAAPVATPAPTLHDVQQLTPESDYTSFMARDVAPDVKNAAMKKLFSDPHFNVMDRMDVYIDDYNQPDPMPATMLRQMASAKFLNLLDEGSEVVAQSVPNENHSNPEPTPHDHADLRLQPDPTPRPEGPGSEPV
jgi:hypothetical protein